MKFIKGINFKKPKYVLPLIILPFLVGFYFLYQRMVGKSIEKQNSIVQQTEGYDISIPIPETDSKIDSKFKSLKEEFNSDESNLRTYIEELEDEEKEQGIIVDLMTPEERAFKDSIDAAKQLSEDLLKKQQENINRMINQNNSSNHYNELADLVSPTNHVQDIQRITSLNEDDIIEKELESNVENELESFTQQMRIIDSIQNPDKYYIAPPVESIPEKEYAKINTGKVENDVFNTITRENKNTSIKALLDEGIIVYKGSRIRLRLMKDVFLNEMYLKKGTYLYGVVKNFKNQRVIINIPSILLDGEIIETNISLYDLDGLEGVFVPSSQFREFVNDLGGGTAGNSGTTLSGQNQTNAGLGDQLLFDAATNAVQTSTKALEKLIRKNKARFKYNSQVILKNS